MPGLIDIGVNLMSPAFERDRAEVLAGAAAAGVQALIITGSTIADSIAAARYAGSANHHYLICKSTAGVHPHNARNWDAYAAHSHAAREQLRELITRDHSDRIIAAVGECGLDYNRCFSPPPDQRRCFSEQLALAAELGKPVFLHEREAFPDFVSMLKEYRNELPGAVVHCFTGGAVELEAYLELDCYIGITGWICDERRGGHLVPLLPRIPADRLLLETDAPYLLPRDLPRAERGKSGRNEPRFLPHIAARAAALLGKSPHQLAAETAANAARLFPVL